MLIDGIQIRVCKNNNESVINFKTVYFSKSKEKFKKISCSISEEVRKIEAQEE